MFADGLPDTARWEILMNEQDRISRIKEEAEKVLFKIPGVHGVGIGHKHTKGKYTSELSIKVYVLRKKALQEIPPEEMIPAEIEGVKTDVVETGPPQRCVDEDPKEYRPARGGTRVSIQHETQVAGGTQRAIGFGTLGFIARTTGNPPIVVGVTNHHVLTLEGTFTKGQAVGQSSPEEYSICSKCCSEIIGVVLDGIDNMAVDVALIKLNRKLDYYNQIQDEPSNFLITGTYSLQTSGIPSSPYHVKKRGERTRLTTGTIDAVSLSFTDQTTNTVTHTGVISIRPDAGLFADHGDSGSAVISADAAAAGKIIALLFANNSTSGFGFAFDIDVVKNQLSGINLPIEILAAGILNNKQTVPDTDAQANAYLVAVGQDESISYAGAEYQLPPKTQGELLQTPEGQHCIGLFQRHQSEVRTLINTNKRVATVWHRNGGPRLLQRVLEIIKTPGQVMPIEVEGQPFADRMSRIINAFMKYGSAELARDCLDVRAALINLGGRTYHEILASLRADLSERTPEMAVAETGA
jgi:hypothetical protein